MNPNEIVNIFKVKENDRKMWKFLDEYSILINEYLESKYLTKEQIIRFMIVGLFPKYRAYILGGKNFTTQSDVDEMNLSFNKYYGRAIESSSEYESFFWRPIVYEKIKQEKQITGTDIFEYVLHGLK